jgi:hypothetical protein
VLAVALLLTVGCSDDDDGGATSTTATSTTEPEITPGEDRSLDGLLLEQADLPPGFEPSDQIDDTITAFCAGEDATAGLQASARSLAGFRRQPEGASVIHLAFRFREGDAARFVQQAGEILDRCSEVPDAQGLAFTYEAAAPEVDAALAGADEHVTRHGVSIGSGNLTIDVGVFRYGEVGELVAVLAVSTPRPELDALAATAFTAAAATRP